MANKEFKDKLYHIELNQVEQQKDIEHIKEKIGKRFSLQNIVAIFSALIALSSLIVNVYIRSQDEKQERIQSYYEPMVLNLEFSKKHKAIEFDDEKVYVKNIWAESTKGFIKTSRTFYIDNSNTIITSPPVKFSEKQMEEAKELKPDERLVTEYTSSIPITGNSNELFYSAQYMLFEDYKGNNELFMIVYVIDKDTRKTKAQFIFDRYYLLLEGQKIFSLPKSKLTSKEQTLAISYINENIKQFSMLNTKLRDLKLID